MLSKLSGENVGKVTVSVQVFHLKYERNKQEYTSIK